MYLLKMRLSRITSANLNASDKVLQAELKTLVLKFWLLGLKGRKIAANKGGRFVTVTMQLLFSL